MLVVVVVVLVYLIAILFHSYLIASAGLIFAALHAGYRLPNVPSRIATPKPNSTSSGVNDATANPPNLVVPETTTAPAALLPTPTLGRRYDASVGAAILPIAIPTTPAIILKRMPSSINWPITVELLKPIALSVQISLVL